MIFQRPATGIIKEGIKVAQDYDNNNTGALFKNDKDGNEKRPDYRGSAEVNGVQYWVSAWIRDKKDGSGKFMSLAFEAKDKPASRPAPSTEIDDDSIPF